MLIPVWCRLSSKRFHSDFFKSSLIRLSPESFSCMLEIKYVAAFVFVLLVPFISTLHYITILKTWFTLPSHLRVATDLLNKLNNCYIENNVLLCTKDVAGLYPSIPHQHGWGNMRYFLDQIHESYPNDFWFLFAVSWYSHDFSSSPKWSKPIIWVNLSLISFTIISQFPSILNISGDKQYCSKVLGTKSKDALKNAMNGFYLSLNFLQSVKGGNLNEISIWCKCH